MQLRIHYEWRSTVPESKAKVCFFEIVLEKMRSLTTDTDKIMYGSTTGTAGQLRNLRKWALPA